MELVLNLVWVCVAIAGILAQMAVLTRGSAASGRRISCWRKIVAMGCALVILFFVISMTDDLHGQEVLVEERRLSRITMTSPAGVLGVAASLRPISLHFHLFFPPAGFSAPSLAMNWLLKASESSSLPPIERETLRSRAPPLSLI